MYILYFFLLIGKWSTVAPRRTLPTKTQKYKLFLLSFHFLLKIQNKIEVNFSLHILSNPIQTYQFQKFTTMSATFTTPKFMNSLAKLAKENRVSNKDVKAKKQAKKQAKAQRVKDIQRQHKIAAQMDKELTKLEKIADKEADKQAKIQAKEDAKQAKIQAKVEAKEEKAQEKEDAKQEKAHEKALAKVAKAQEKAHEKALAKEAKAQEKAHEKAVAKEAKAQEKAVAKKTNTQEKKTKKAIKVVERNDRQDIIQTLCEKLGHGNVNTDVSVEVTA